MAPMTPNSRRVQTNGRHTASVAGAAPHLSVAAGA